ncbi:hypothetical protein BTJ40_07710 [Microbulbifer sp. A4B17]|uniref:hypothetical protein n=1 Tax=Microbulbifer sp. A4B17 TaxID=359370 RepID=UPI000D52DB52|nr:hypothetical protein [Microbulbifer sp. A4B17]AWF80711.1 hypothetical protein BTJ40_07710 [Microbulbifer sp. A4B17]
MKTTSLTIALTAALISANTSYAQQDVSYKKCKKWQSKIEQLHEKRKDGGSGEQMEKWRGKIKKLKEKFKDYNCDQYKRNL